MERILVIMNAQYNAWEALGGAISLAKRIKSTVFILRVFTPDNKEGLTPEQFAKTSAACRLDSIIQNARSDSVNIEYFVTEGDFNKEVIRFVEHNKISLLIVESGILEGNILWNSEKRVCHVKDILYNISCRVEVVSPKNYYKI
ncbi:MAG: universal stress protein [Proteobacteria bacterium]|nr:universal stress protein [Pseudomonadota bacterium]